MKGIRIFLGHARFYRRFIKDFSKISKPLCKLLEKDAHFDFDESSKSACQEIKSRLVIDRRKTRCVKYVPKYAQVYE